MPMMEYSIEFAVLPGGEREYELLVFAGLLVLLPAVGCQ